MNKKTRQDPMIQTPSPKVTMIIPCVGFGSQITSSEIKELTNHPIHKRPFIDHSLLLAQKYNWNPLLITRPEKKNLIDYVHEKSKDLNIHIQWVLVGRSSEWPENILKSQPYWGERNILIEPNTEWIPPGAEKEMILALDSYDLTYGLFNSSELCHHRAVRIENHEVHLCEKPNTKLKDFSTWGLIAFRRVIGILLFQKILESCLDHQIKKFPVTATSVSLDLFQELH